MVFDAALAGRYDAGRRLRPVDIDAWMAAARPFLPGPGGRVLDLGAGTGRFTAALAGASGAAVVACEPSAAMRLVCPARPLVGGSAEGLPFRDATFDAIWASQMIHHVTDLEAFTAGVRRVLRPGGRLLLRGGFGPPDDLPYYQYFPAAWPDRTEMASVLAAVDLPRVAHLKVSQVLAESPWEFVERARSRSLSNLATLDDAVFAEGLRAMEQDATEGHLPARIVEQLDLIVFAGWE